MSAISLVGDLRDLNRAHARWQANVGDAKDEAVKASAVILARSWRKVLSVRGGGTPSPAGEAPRKQKGVLQKSVGQGVVGTGRIVAVQRFTALFLEEGVNTSGSTATKSAVKGRGRHIRSRRIRSGGGLVIKPRPSAQRALDAAKADMTGVTAEILAGVRP